MWLAFSLPCQIGDVTLSVRLILIVLILCTSSALWLSQMRNMDLAERSRQSQVAMLDAKFRVDLQNLRQYEQQQIIHFNEIESARIEERLASLEEELALAQESLIELNDEFAQAEAKFNATYTELVQHIVQHHRAATHVVASNPDYSEYPRLQLFRQFFKMRGSSRYLACVAYDYEPFVTALNPSKERREQIIKKMVFLPSLDSGHIDTMAEILTAEELEEFRRYWNSIKQRNLC